MVDTSRRAVMITGASSGIGATYADRFAERGHGLVLVARDNARLESIAGLLQRENGIRVDILPADLTDPSQLAAVENRLRGDDRIGILVNNAGAAIMGAFATADMDALERLIRLNVTSVVRLAGAVVPRFVAEGDGAIINLSSVLALAPEAFGGIYPATKSFVLTFSLALQTELAAKGVYVQAVLPASTRTEIWQRSGMDIDAISGVMPVDELVDAALAGFDRKELVTIPPLPDEQQWSDFEAARLAMRPNFRQEHPAARYRT
ncbi:MAG: SDR family NAD(P)-dependent oxidoreductase [Rhodopila sp.]